MKDLLEEMSEDGIGLGYFFKNSSDSFRDVLKQIREEGIFNIFVAISDDIDIFLKQVRIHANYKMHLCTPRTFLRPSEKIPADPLFGKSQDRAEHKDVPICGIKY